MLNQDAHLSDVELLQIIDAEMPGSDASRMEAHLTGCWQCRTRRSELEDAIANYVHVHRSGSKLPPMDEPRARLLAALVQLASVKPVPAPKSSLRLTQVAYAGAAACLIVLVGAVMYFSVLRAGAAPIPDEHLTPGVTRDVSKDDICSAGTPEGFYPIPATVAVSVFQKYRIENPRPRSYEVDYLITPALGGAEDIRNLWPQPYASGEWNAHVKDALEHHLHDLVCSGKLDLKTAQRDIATNWIAAYRKYFQTEKPLTDHVAFAGDPAWEN